MVLKKVTTKSIKEMKIKGEKITMLTAYDFLMASQLDQCGMDIILVGDSLGNVVLGYENTIPVTMEEMIHHCAAVSRGVDRAMVVGDMPFMSYQVSAGEAVRNAGRLLKEAGVEAVKLEGGEEFCKTIKKIVGSGIPVMGHLGFTPQSIYKFGGYGVRGKEEEQALKILEDAKELEEAGVFSIVLEKIPAVLAGEITEAVSVPTIGIGAGVDCDGQVLVTHDMLGLYEKFKPGFSKRYSEIGSEMKRCFREYIKEVKNKKFPGKEHSY
ncbi:MAG: 3-methyl-2-oxobutanoate hydroxymethyltransferase [Actinomycetota bacterium]|nr:3-methyl-2-oxobutanoate hydroxymethyltransferase [Actinomycetota bacterium]